MTPPAALFFAAIHRRLMNDDTDQPRDDSGASTPQPRGDGADLVGAALGYLRRGVSADRGPSGTPTLARQKVGLVEWARGLGLELNEADLLPRLIRGGQERGWTRFGERIIKVIRHGVFGLSTGIELALEMKGLGALVKNFTNLPSQMSRFVIGPANRTCQGYGRKSTLKPAGLFLYPGEAERSGR